MIVLSLFDGMSCGQIALKEIGINIDTYYASEIDKYAIKQTQHNFPNTIQLGNVLNWKNWAIDWKSINLILAGSPCQGFSFGGEQLGFDDPRSKLFFVFIDIFNHVKKLNPNVKFLLENVDMKRKHMKVISDYCGVFPVNINSNLVSAQNRNRWYWTNIRTKQIGLFDEIHSDIPQPKDEKILLRNILEQDVDKKYYLSKKMINWLNRHAEKRKCKIKINNGFDKIACITSTAQVKQNLTTEYVCTDGVNIRRLTPNECSRAQTIPIWYQWIVSDTQIFKILGNGWTVDVIKHIFSFL